MTDGADAARAGEEVTDGAAWRRRDEDGDARVRDEIGRPAALSSGEERAGANWAATRAKRDMAVWDGGGTAVAIRDGTRRTDWKRDGGRTADGKRGVATRGPRVCARGTRGCERSPRRQVV